MAVSVPIYHLASRPPVRGEVRHSKDLPPPKSADAVRPAAGSSRRTIEGTPRGKPRGALDLSDWLSPRFVPRRRPLPAQMP
jgi:hypothetical protein